MSSIRFFWVPWQISGPLWIFIRYHKRTVQDTAIGDETQWGNVTHLKYCRATQLGIENKWPLHVLLKMPICVLLNKKKYKEELAILNLKKGSGVAQIKLSISLQQHRMRGRERERGWLLRSRTRLVICHCRLDDGWTFNSQPQLTVWPR